MSPITTANLASTCAFPVICLPSNEPASNFLYFDRDLPLKVDVCGGLNAPSKSLTIFEIFLAVLERD